MSGVNFLSVSANCIAKLNLKFKKREDLEAGVHRIASSRC